MKKIFQTIFDFLGKIDKLSNDELDALMELLKTADREMEIAEFKFQRLEKENRTMEVLLDETITELQARTHEAEQAREDVERTNTELEATLENLTNTQQQLVFSAKMASLGELIAGVAHEIQNPLNFVINFSNLTVELAEELRAEYAIAAESEVSEQKLAEMQTLMDDLIEIQHKILSHGTRAEKIVKSMLLHSRKEEGHREQVDIAYLVGESATLAYRGARGNNPKFHCEILLDIDTSLPAVNIVVQDIRSVMLNILGNAFYAMNDKRKTADHSYSPVLTIKVQGQDGGVAVTFTDNGPGIPKDILDKVFNPFFTTKPAGVGTGLGLSLGFDMVQSHGGTLTVDTIPGESTTFRMYLPGIHSER